MAHWEESTEPWVFGDWTVLDEDRPYEANKPCWTLIPPNNYSGGSLCRGPFGRKAINPETVIYACGYETEGIDFAGNFLEYLLTLLNGPAKPSKEAE